MSNTEDEGIRGLLMRIRYDLTAAQGKLTDAFALLDTLGLQEKRRGSFPNGPVLADACDLCGVGVKAGAYAHAADCPHLLEQLYDLAAEEDRARETSGAASRSSTLT